MTSRLTRLREPALTMLAVAGIFPAFSLLPLLVFEAGNLDAGEFAWSIGALVLGAALLAGLVVRVSSPSTSTALFVVGAAAPSVAWFWLPPVYLLSVLIVVVALVDARPRAAQLTDSS